MLPRLLATLHTWAETRCAACLTPFAPNGTPFCPPCRAAIQPHAALCPLCGIPVQSDQSGQSVQSDQSGQSGQSVQSGQSGQSGPHPLPCAACLAAPPPWQRLYALGAHTGIVRALLLRGKYSGDRGVYRALGVLLAARILTAPHNPLAGVILPMPLHPTRLRTRGFNQCRELAAPLARQLNLPERPDLAARTVFTRPQTGLHRSDRLRNVTRHMFSAHPGVAGQHILLVEDTLTTGATLRRLTECLLEAGAAGVEAAVVAIAPARGSAL